MNNRRKLIVALGASATSAPLAAFAQRQGKVWRIGWIAYGRSMGGSLGLDAFRAGLRDLV